MERVQILILKEIGNLLKDKHEEKRKSSYTTVGLIFSRLSLLFGRGFGLGPGRGPFFLDMVTSNPHCS